MLNGLPQSAGSARPMPINVSKDRIHAFAEGVASRLHFSPKDTIEPLVARLGGTVTYRDSASVQSGPPESMIVETDRKFTIYLPTMTSMERDRFTIAHELGHLFLHYPAFKTRHSNEAMIATRWVDESDPTQQRAEWEANWFAAGFLMPAPAFREAWARCGSADIVAIEFGVSPPAAKIRAGNLGLK